MGGRGKAGEIFAVENVFDGGVECQSVSELLADDALDGGVAG